MTTPTTVTDTALETMLARRAHRADPAGLADAVFASFETIEPRRGPRLGVPAWWLPGRPNRGVAWVLVAAGLLVALLASALVGGGLLDGPRPHISLEPTGIEITTTMAGANQRVFADGNGTLWASWPNHLARLDPATGKRRAWNLSDGLAFGSSLIAPARAGGVWIWSDTPIRSNRSIGRFTGEGFVEFIPTTLASVDDFAEAQDGSLWAASPERGLERWDGDAWAPAPAGRPMVGTGALLVGRDGDVWVANREPSVGESGVVGRGVSHLEAGRWTTYDAVRDIRASFPSGLIAAIEEAADGSVWAVGHGELARFDGTAWAQIDGPGFSAEWLATAPDGSVWVAGSSTYAPAVARYANGQWTTYGVEDGIVGAVGPVSATPTGIFLATDRGLLHFVDERWTVLWPDMAVGPQMGTFADRLLAVSEDEAWAANERGIWHYVDSGWTWPELPAGWSARPRGLAVAPDGTLWATTGDGVAALRDGEWTVAWRRSAWSIAIAPDGTAWAGSFSGQIVGLRLDGSPPRTISCPVGSSALAVTADGIVYVGQISYSGKPGLARFDGRTCEKVDPIGDGRTVEVVDLDADPTGGLVAVMFRQESPNTGPTTSYVARLDGERWTILEEVTTEGGYLHDGGVTTSPSGEVWRSGIDSGAGLERYAGGRWSPVDPAVGSFGPPSIAEDGTLWFIDAGEVQRLRAEDVRP
jgi:hypothetical protein